MSIRGKIVGFFDKNGTKTDFEKASTVLVSEPVAFIAHSVDRFDFVPHIGQKVIVTKTNVIRA